VATPRTFNPLGFSERNELFVGRVAMIGLVASLVGERVSGKGALAQLGMETGLPTYEVEPLLLLLVAVAATSAVVPFHDKFIGDTAPAALGLRYTASRQRLLGRLSMLAFFSSLILEALTGSGPLDMLELDTGVPMNEVTGPRIGVWCVVARSLTQS
jgi:photosystem II protein